MKRLAGLACALALAACSGLKVPAGEAPSPAREAAGAPTAEVEKQATQHIDRLRTILPQADVSQAARYNKILEDAWKYFDAHPEALGAIRRALQRELAQPRRNDFILLDLGYYLHGHGTAGDKLLARNALYTLDPNAEIVRFNQQELFQFAQAVATARDAGFLAFADRAFLRERVSVRFPEANITLDPATVCAFIYGAYGDGAEAHLRGLLKAPAKASEREFARKLLEILIWIGSPAANPEVKAVLIGATRDYDTFMRTTTFLMTLGGPQGRSIVLAVQAGSLDLWTRSYYERVRAAALATSYKSMRAKLAGSASAAILDSPKPRAELLAQVTAQRMELFRGAPTPARVADIQRANATLNALRYRDE